MSTPSPPEQPPATGRTGGKKQLPHLTRLHKALIGIISAGGSIIATIGFSGSYSAVKDLAVRRGFGHFAPFVPLGVDAGIIVLLALDLLLTWIRMPFPLLRQAAWLLTAATIAFNGAAAWPDPVGVSMHAVIPLLFIITVEAARHAVGRLADISEDKDMDGVRFSRWILSFPSTFRLWRRMKLWELRSYERVINMEQDRLIYEARLRARYGRGWRRQAPVDAMTPLRLARYGVPIAQTGEAGLAAAGITGPMPWFTDISADTARTTPDGRTNAMSAPEDTTADIAADTKEDAAMSGDTMSPAGRELSPVSARTSAPDSGQADSVRADNGERPRKSENPQHSGTFSKAGVRLDSPPRPRPAAPAAAVSAPDNTRADTNAADNDGRADKKADTTPLAADNTADTRADKNPPRGAMSAGIRAQLAAGITDRKKIAKHLEKELGRPVSAKDVARIIRRDEEKAQKGQREPAVGLYM